MSSESSDWERQLLLLRSLTESTGIIHEAQVVQIKNWGAVALPSMNFVAKVDVNKKTVTYSVTGKNKVSYKTIAPYVAALDRSIHWLLGDSWSTYIDLNETAIYRGKRKVKSKKKVDESRK
jgi:hypothetical protein